MQNNPPHRLIFLCAVVISFATTSLRAAEPSAAAAPTNAAPVTAKPAPPTTLEATEADKAWIDVQRAMRPPPQPEAWRTKPPTEKEQGEYFMPFIIAAADKAKDYYTKYPKETMATTARFKEHELLGYAVSYGNTNQQARLEILEKAMLADPKITDDQRFDLRRSAMKRAAAANASGGRPAFLAAMEKGIRELQKDFPKRPEIAEMLMELASNSEGDKARALLKEVAEGNASPQVKAAATASLNKMEAVGKPCTLKFTALDGKEVEVAKMTGKVVLVDFWATWCRPCMAALPEVKETYEKLHGKGFEIVGINLDQSKEQLQKVLTDQKMTWAQYFDGQGWGNKIAQQYEIQSIPTMWLVDKKGNLRDTNARGDLAAKVEKLLAE